MSASVFASDNGQTGTTTTAANENGATLGTVLFKASNSKRVPVGKTTVLYLTIKDISGVIDTEFSTSNSAVASIEKINNTSVRVLGLKTGEVIITAVAGGKTAKYTLRVGNSTAQTTENPVSSEQSGGAGGAGAVDDPNEGTPDDGTELDLFSSTSDELAEYIENSRQSDAGSILLGLVAFVVIFGGFGFVLSVIFRSRTPKFNLYPGSKRRFNTSNAYRGKARKRLLPDHYYRANRKY
jgi:hypothetical protein